MSMQLKIKRLKPRNPLVLPSTRRKAGAHQTSAGARRLRAHRATEREVHQALQGPPMT